MARLFVSDLDGTLFNVFHATDFIILRGIKKIIKRGDYFAIATGRNMRPEHIRGDFKDLPVYCIAMNGAIILNPNKEIIYERIIDKTIIQELLEKFPMINFEFIGRKHCYMKCSEIERNKDRAYMPFIIKMIYRRFNRLCPTERVYNCSDEEILKQDILKFNCHINDEKIIKAFNEYLEQNKDKLVNAPYGGTLYEVTPAGVNKGNTIKHLTKLLNVKENDVYVYGDGENDIAMLKAFDNSYAPSNASENAKHAAKHAIGSNAKYSVIRHMLNVNKNR